MAWFEDAKEATRRTGDDPGASNGDDASAELVPGSSYTVYVCPQCGKLIDCPWVIISDPCICGGTRRATT